MRSTTCGASAAPAISEARPTAPQRPGGTGNGTRPPRRAACHGVAAPSPTTLQAPSSRRSIAATIVCAASSGCRSENGGSDIALTGTTGSRNNRPNGLGTCEPTTGAYRNAPTGTPQRSAPPLAAASTASSQRPYGVVGAGTASSSGTDTRPVGGPYTSSPLRTTTYSSAPVLAAALSVAVVQQ